jgi:hypothetical protein
MIMYLFIKIWSGVVYPKERLLDEQSKSDNIDAAGAAYLLYLRDVHGLSFRISVVMPELGSKAIVLHHLIIQKQQYNKQATQLTNSLPSYWQSSPKQRAGILRS